MNKNIIYTRIDVIKSLCELVGYTEKNHIKNNLDIVEERFFNEPNASECLNEFYKTCVLYRDKVFPKGKLKTNLLTINTFFHRNEENVKNSKGIWKYYIKPKDSGDPSSKIENVKKLIKDYSLICALTINNKTTFIDWLTNKENLLHHFNAKDGYVDSFNSCSKYNKILYYEEITDEMITELNYTFKSFYTFEKDANSMLLYAVTYVFFKFAKTEPKNPEETERLIKKISELNLPEDIKSFLLELEV